MNDKIKLGATGRFPEGKLTEDDEGELAIAVGIKSGHLIIDFGDTPVKWLAMPPRMALDFANNIGTNAVALLLAQLAILEKSDG